MPAPTRIRRCSSSSMARARSAGITATSCSTRCAAGLRVIVPDLPHYGMSGPGNLDKSPARTMQDMREVVHDLVVNQLGVKKAYLSRPLTGRPGRDGLRPDLAGSRAGPRARSACGTGGISTRDHHRARQKGPPVRPVLRPRFRQVEADLGPDRHPASGKGACPSRTSATSSTSRSAIQRPARCRQPRAATSSTTASMPASTPSSASG